MSVETLMGRFTRQPGDDGDGDDSDDEDLV